MLLKVSSPALSHLFGSSLSSPENSLPPSFSSVSMRNLKRGGSTAVSMEASGVTGVVFEPFKELQSELNLVPTSPEFSLARHKFVDNCEAAINEQIKSACRPDYKYMLATRAPITIPHEGGITYAQAAPIRVRKSIRKKGVEYNVSYVYHAMFAYFDRDNVALKGMAKFFKESSEEEREHAEKLMVYQNKRGGRVKLQSILTPLTEFDHPEKGDALYAMELALSLEKLVNEKLLNLHGIAEQNNDPQLTDFVESEFLAEQVEAIKKISEYVAQLRRIGKGHAVWHFDRALLE